jgi:hypothetical protein
VINYEEKGLSKRTSAGFTLCSIAFLILILFSCLRNTSVPIAHGSGAITAIEWEGSGVILSGGYDTLKVTARNPEDYGLDLYIKFSWTPSNSRLSVDNAVHHFGPNEVYTFSVAVTNLGPEYRTTGTLSVIITDHFGILTAGSDGISFTLSTRTQPTTLSVQVTNNEGTPLNKFVAATWNHGVNSDSKWSGSSGTAVFEFGSGYVYEGDVEVTVEQKTQTFHVTEGDNTGTIVLSSQQPSPSQQLSPQPSSSLPPYLFYSLLAILGIAVVVIAVLVLNRRRH